jgi:hypothetical protein
MVLLLLLLQMMTMEGVHFQRYDHGTNCSRHEPFYETCNQQEYGSMEPPQYDMSRITAPQVRLVCVLLLLLLTLTTTPSGGWAAQSHRDLAHLLTLPPHPPNPPTHTTPGDTQVFMSGELDIMSTPEDVNTQRARLQPGVLKAEYVYQSYAHMDYVWDRNARHAFDLVDILYRYSPGTY